MVTAITVARFTQMSPLLALAGFVIGTIGAEFATIFNNAMMTRLVPPERLGRLSGTGWAVGYIGGLVSLIIVARIGMHYPAQQAQTAGQKREGDQTSSEGHQ